MSQPGAAPVHKGDLLAGKYRVERVLGTGGMGIVVAARHEQLDQLVAIKFVRDEALGNAEGVERFLREARAAARLKSEHAARVLDVGTLASGAPYMVMEYLDGSDLAQVLSERGPLPIDVAADWVLQACEAVAEAHAAGIVHRDLKPQNLFLARTVGGTSKVKVLDFGVSKSMGSSFSEKAALTRTRSMLGSPLYMAPEQMRSSRDVDSRVDVWALGVVLFELLTQRWPFEADGMPELCLKVVTDAPLSILALRPDAPPSLVEIIERCLEKDPAKRFSNAAELASALEPLAPAGSRVTAERARLAMGNVSVARPTASTAAREAAPPGRAAPTPAAWGSGRLGTSPVTAAKRGRPALWVAVGLGTVAGVVLAAVFALRSPAAHPASSTQVGTSLAAASELAPPPVVSLTTPSLTTPSTAALDSVPVIAEIDARSSAYGGGLTPIAPFSASSRTSIPSAPSAASSFRVAAPAVARTVAPARMPPVGPAAKDDDIPKIR
jgi:tRNA A-37 threonylcarbamoyl transferase component Bud32